MHDHLYIREKMRCVVILLLHVASVTCQIAGHESSRGGDYYEKLIEARHKSTTSRPAARASMIGGGIYTYSDALPPFGRSADSMYDEVGSRESPSPARKQAPRFQPPKGGPTLSIPTAAGRLAPVHRLSARLHQPPPFPPPPTHDSFPEADKLPPPPPRMRPGRRPPKPTRFPAAKHQLPPRLPPSPSFPLPPIPPTHDSFPEADKLPPSRIRSKPRHSPPTKNHPATERHISPVYKQPPMPPPSASFSLPPVPPTHDSFPEADKLPPPRIRSDARHSPQTIHRTVKERHLAAKRPPPFSPRARFPFPPVPPTHDSFPEADKLPPPRIRSRPRHSPSTSYHVATGSHLAPGRLPSPSAMHPLPPTHDSFTEADKVPPPRFRSEPGIHPPATPHPAHHPFPKHYPPPGPPPPPRYPGPPGYIPESPVTPPPGPVPGPAFGSHFVTDPQPTAEIRPSPSYPHPLGYRPPHKERLPPSHPTPTGSGPHTPLAYPPASGVTPPSKYLPVSKPAPAAGPYLVTDPTIPTRPTPPPSYPHPPGFRPPSKERLPSGQPSPPGSGPYPTAPRVTQQSSYITAPTQGSDSGPYFVTDPSIPTGPTPPFMFPKQQGFNPPPKERRPSRPGSRPPAQTILPPAAGVSQPPLFPSITKPRSAARSPLETRHPLPKRPPTPSKIPTPGSLPPGSEVSFRARPLPDFPPAAGVSPPQKFQTMPKPGSATGSALDSRHPLQQSPPTLPQKQTPGSLPPRSEIPYRTNPLPEYPPSFRVTPSPSYSLIPKLGSASGPNLETGPPLPPRPAPPPNFPPPPDPFPLSNIIPPSPFPTPADNSSASGHSERPGQDPTLAVSPIIGTPLTLKHPPSKSQARRGPPQPSRPPLTPFPPTKDTLFPPPLKSTSSDAQPPVDPQALIEFIRLVHRMPPKGLRIQERVGVNNRPPASNTTSAPRQRPSPDHNILVHAATSTQPSLLPPDRPSHPAPRIVRPSSTRRRTRPTRLRPRPALLPPLLSNVMKTILQAVRPLPSSTSSPSGMYANWPPVNPVSRSSAINEFPVIPPERSGVPRASDIRELLNAIVPPRRRPHVDLARRPTPGMPAALPRLILSALAPQSPERSPFDHASLPILQADSPLRNSALNTIELIPAAVPSAPRRPVIQSIVVISEQARPNEPERTPTVKAVYVG